eukprot:gnl/Dysnectes_brevis/3078_a3824_901.p1 GENE.gnl/Dysnectes_brevis/3078_a3824_901~~gnl/Dysnectes_brevis/3078_a3824_901.p1  ORF type:complete len:365 (+),score=79.41 gnl/Dysnectes_brevis/3078_a3824_901:207-1301(+)
MIPAPNHHLPKTKLRWSSMEDEEVHSSQHILSHTLDFFRVFPHSSLSAFDPKFAAKEVSRMLKTIHIRQPPNFQMEDITCSLCHHYLDQPMVATACSHVFCRRCSPSFKAVHAHRGAKCPICQANSPIVSCSHTSRLHSEVIIRCPCAPILLPCTSLAHQARAHHMAGHTTCLHTSACRWRGPLPLLPSHLMRCRLLPVPCQACGYTVTRSSLITGQHAVECPNWSMRCCHCLKMGDKQQMLDHGTVCLEDQHQEALEAAAADMTAWADSGLSGPYDDDGSPPFTVSPPRPRTPCPGCGSVLPHVCEEPVERQRKDTRLRDKQSKHAFVRHLASMMAEQMPSGCGSEVGLYRATFIEDGRGEEW